MGREQKNYDTFLTFENFMIYGRANGFACNIYNVFFLAFRLVLLFWDIYKHGERAED